MSDWRNWRMYVSAALPSFGFVPKALTCVCGAILVAASGDELFRRVEEHIASEHDPAPARMSLTPAESRIAALVADGLTNQEIADRLGVGPKTVETHLSRIFRKFGIRSRDELQKRQK